MPTSPDPSPRRPRPVRKKRPGIVGRVLGYTTLAAIAAGALYVGKIASGIGGSGGLKSVIDSVRDPRGQFPGKDRVNILLVGKDYSYDAKFQRYTAESRADTILMVSLDLEKKSVSMLSIPRDTWVTAPDGESGRINGTYNRGRMALLSRTVAQLTGVDPDYTVELKGDAVENIVDSLGGVTVETRDAFEYHDWKAGLHVKMGSGVQRIDGRTAIGFARYRKPDPYYRDADGKPLYPISNNDFRKKPHREIRSTMEDGDDKRQQRQQLLVRALISEAKKPGNLMKADRLVNVGLGQVDTSLTRVQIYALANLFKGIQTDQMASGSLPGTDGRVGRLYAFVVDRGRAKLMANWLLRGDEAAADKLIRISVQNGTKVAGAAKKAVDLLHDRGGFDAKVDRSAPTPPRTDSSTPAPTPESTRILYARAVFAPRAERIAKMLGGGKVMKDTTPGATDPERPDIVVVLGNDIAPRLTGQRSARLPEPDAR